MHLGERIKETRTGRTKVRLGTDGEVSCMKYSKLGCVQTQRQGEPGSDSRGAVRDYKELVTRGQGTDVATDSQGWNREHAPNILDYSVIKRSTANIYCIITLPDTILSVPSHLVHNNPMK